MAAHSQSLASFLNAVARDNPGQSEFLQAVREVLSDVLDYACADRRYSDARILERLVEPDRVISFRVVWHDDKGQVQVNRGWRVQHSLALGPYKGGIRFHPSVTEGTLKFLAFEQTFKNALTGLALGGGKGGSNFDPKGKSEAEVMRFCQAFMTELTRYVDADTDVPAGDIGVGNREVGFMYGQYKRLTSKHTGVFTGKGIGYGGSPLRPEATGYGAVFFLEHMLQHVGEQLQGQKVLVSGSGNVAQYAVEKLLQLGALPLTMSDSGGFIHDPDGIDAEKLAFVMDLKNNRRGRIQDYVQRFTRSTFHGNGARPWVVSADIALPCATQNEIDDADATTLIRNGIRTVVEGANMPSTLEAIQRFLQAGVLFGPAKAVNAGGVGCSGLEMSQNSQRLTWTTAEVEERLHAIMRSIHDTCLKYGSSGSTVNYVKGANIGSFVRVADAMLSQGVY